MNLYFHTITIITTPIIRFKWFRSQSSLNKIDVYQQNLRCCLKWDKQMGRRMRRRRGVFNKNCLHKIFFLEMLPESSWIKTRVVAKSKTGQCSPITVTETKTWTFSISSFMTFQSLKSFVQLMFTLFFSLFFFFLPCRCLTSFTPLC